jgi:Fe-S-cluster containining protein
MSDTCATCNGNCCYNVIVRIMGYDAWRIKRAQALDFSQFVAAEPEADPKSDAFRIGDAHYALFLAKNPAVPTACTFLMLFPDEICRCGIYAERPRVCSVYPMTLRFGAVDLRSDVVCKASNWDMATLSYPKWRRALLEHNLESVAYFRVAQHWNHAAPADATLADYYGYVERCFDRIDALRSDLGDDFEDLILHWQDASPENDDITRRTAFEREIELACSAALAKA